MAKTKAAPAAAAGPPDKAPAVKKAKTIDAHFKQQVSAGDAACKYLLEYAGTCTTEPAGYKLLRQEADDLKVLCDEAIADEDWDEAKRLEVRRLEVIAQADHEKKLLDSARMSMSHAQSAYDHFRKLRNIDLIAHYKNVLNTAEAYLNTVPEDDLVEERIVIAPSTQGPDDPATDDATADGGITITIDDGEEDDAADGNGSDNPASDSEGEDGGAEDSSSSAGTGNRSMFRGGKKSKASRGRKGRKYMERFNRYE